MRRSAALTVLVLACGAGGDAAWAQYKVVDAQGKVTYTDTPPRTGVAKVTRLRSDGGGAGADDASASPLPAALRQVAERYPVVLYATADCAGCDAGRAQLQGRGIPFNERLIVTADDEAALSRLTGGTELPALRIGTQALHGYAPAVWQSYLSAAGYPVQSTLQADYRAPAPQPLTRPPVRPPKAAPASTDAAGSTATAPPSPTGIAF